LWRTYESICKKYLSSTIYLLTVVLSLSLIN
jgi:hypothetical protein